LREIWDRALTRMPGSELSPDHTAPAGIAGRPRMRECSIEKNKASCNCTYEPCSRKGICCECLRYHLDMGEFPACFFPDDVERTYDRTIERFIETYRERGAWW